MSENSQNRTLNYAASMSLKCQKQKWCARFHQAVTRLGRAIVTEPGALAFGGTETPSDEPGRNTAVWKLLLTSPVDFLQRAKFREAAPPRGLEGPAVNILAALQ